MKKVTIFSLLCSAISLFGVENWVSRRDYQVSPYWSSNRSDEIPFRMMFDFWDGGEWKAVQNGAWHSVLAGSMLGDQSRLVPGTEKLSQMPIFKDSWLAFRSWPDTDFRKIGSGEKAIGMDYFLNHRLREFVELSEKHRRFFTVISRTREAKMFYEENYQPDMQEFQHWCREYPHFLGFKVGEWCNDYLSLSERKFRQALDKKMITEDEYHRGVEKNKLPGDSRGLTRFFTDIFHSHAKFLFADPANLIMMHAYWNLAHLSACNGAGQILLETTNSTGRSYDTYRWQASMFYARGAARQFQTRWSWYIASFYNGYDLQGNFLGSQHYSYKAGGNPWGGMSQSMVRRAHYLSWLSGAFMAYRESASGTLFKQDDEDGEYKLTPFGEDSVRFYEHTQSNDRGVPYTPVALLVPYEWVQTASGGHAWCRTSEYPKGLYMIDAVMSTILPGYDRPQAIRNGHEGCLYNSPYGDIFDVLTADAPCTDPLKVLQTYKVAVLLGSYDAQKLQAVMDSMSLYVKAGGTLVLNSAQLGEDCYKELTGLERTGKTVESGGYTLAEVNSRTAQPLLKDPEGNVLFLSNQYGDGRVIVCTAEYLVPSAIPPSSAQALGGLVRYDHIRTLLARLTEETLPVRVEGNIQYGVNRTGKGFLVYLFNNRGVTKFTDQREVLDPAMTSQVSVFLKDGALLSAHDIMSGNSLTVTDNTVACEVGPGGIALLVLEK